MSTGGAMLWDDIKMQLACETKTYLGWFSRVSFNGSDDQE